MTITDEQASQIKESLLQQIDSSFPEEKKEAAKQQIQTMDNDQLEEFLKQNNLLKTEGGGQEQQGQCIFCSIVFGETPSTKIGENEKAISVLEINPISKGHSLIIPKEHIETKENLPKESQELAKEISEKINAVLKPKNILIENKNMFGHEVLEIIPVYNNENQNSQRTKADQEELNKLKEQFDSIKKEPEPKEPVKEQKQEEPEINDKNTWLPKRIP